MTSATFTSALALKSGATLAAAAAATLFVYAMASRETFLSRAYARYVQHLDRTLRVLFRPEIGLRIAHGQAMVFAAIVALHVAIEVPWVWLLLVLTLVSPSIYLVRERQTRITKLEEQVDGFVVALANSLKTVPSPAAALHATASILQQPTRQEIEHVLKEMRVGSTLEQGLVAMSARLKSRWLDVALSAVLIGLRVGGNLPTVLERTAATIREMNRLLGVVRTKTGEGRMQLWVLAVFPIVIVFLLNFIQDGYFDPLRTTITGQICVGVASTLWIASLLVARKVLTVDV